MAGPYLVEKWKQYSDLTPFAFFFGRAFIAIVLNSCVGLARWLVTEISVEENIAYVYLIRQ